MSAEEHREYKKRTHQKRVAEMQDELQEKYEWLAYRYDPACGRHCNECVQRPISNRASDKLSTGYGHDADGEPKPIPNEHKCEYHEATKEHRNAVRLNQVRLNGQAPPPRPP